MERNTEGDGKKDGQADTEEMAKGWGRERKTGGKHTGVKGNRQGGEGDKDGGKRKRDKSQGGRGRRTKAQLRALSWEDNGGDLILVGRGRGTQDGPPSLTPTLFLGWKIWTPTTCSAGRVTCGPQHQGGYALPLTAPRRAGRGETLRGR